jgi:hypothetical protein
VSAILARLAFMILSIAALVAIALLARDQAQFAFMGLGFLKWNKKALLLKNEVTYATDAVPTGAANAILGYDVGIKPLRLRPTGATSRCRGSATRAISSPASSSRSTSRCRWRAAARRARRRATARRSRPAGSPRR